MATEVKEPTPQELMLLIGVAGVAGDLAEVIRLGNLLKKHQVDIQKAEMEKLKAESEALAGERGKLTDKIKGVVEAALLKAFTNKEHVFTLFAELEAVKAKGYKVTEAGGLLTVALDVPTIKTRASGGGGGSTGALKAQTGLARHELVDLYATETEKASIAKAETEAVTRKDSARYTAEKPVIKRILADHPDLIKK